MNKKGVLLLVLAITLVMFSAFSIAMPDFLVAEDCRFGYNIVCFNGMYGINSSDDDTLIIKLKNNFGTVVYLSDVRVDAFSGDVICNDVTIDWNPIQNQSYRWEDGESFTLRADCVNGSQLKVGKKERFDIGITWYTLSAGDGFKKNIKGSVLAKVHGEVTVKDKSITHVFLVVSTIFLGLFFVLLVYYIKLRYGIFIDRKIFHFLSIFIAMIVSFVYASSLFFFVPYDISNWISKIAFVVFVFLSIYIFRRLSIEVDEIVDMSIVFVIYLIFGGITYFLYVNVLM